MHNTEYPTELALQICFGIFGVFSTVATLAGLHYHDSLGCVLLRRLRGRRVPRDNDLEESAADTSLANVDGSMDDTSQFERRPTLPPSYEQSSEGLHLETFQDSSVGDGPAGNKRNGP